MIKSKTKITILVVDDQFVFREVHKMHIAAYLKDKTDYEILTANGLNEAHEVAQKIYFDAVFTDLHMDDKHDCGYILAEKIKAMNPQTMVYIVSNADLDSIEKIAEKAGATGCFQIPLKDLDLKQVFHIKFPRR